MRGQRDREAGEEIMEPAVVASRFKFESNGTTRGALFRGPVVLLPEGLLLAAKGVTTQSANTAMAVAGVFGLLIAWAFSSLAKVEFPYPAISCADLPGHLRGIKGFEKLKPKHRLVALRCDEILGYEAPFLRGFKVVCTGEDVTLIGSTRKLAAAFSRFGYAEYEPDDPTPA